MYLLGDHFLNISTVLGNNDTDNEDIRIKINSF